MLPHSALVDYLVYQTVFPCFLRDHPVIPLGVGLDLLRRLAGILGKDLIDTLLDLQEVLHVPLAPQDSRNAPMLAAMPMQMVDTSHLMYCMVS